MPRRARGLRDNSLYHVINRGNNRGTVFHNDGDYFAFVRTVDEACKRTPMRVLAFCLMPNHFHLVVWPETADNLSEWMRWLQITHTRRYHKLRGTSGHIWQGRFKSFEIESNSYLNTVMKYVENNPVRGGMVSRAEVWPWSSAGFWLKSGADARLMDAVDGAVPDWLTEGPVERPKPWLRFVNSASVESELIQLRQSIARELPYGSPGWVEQVNKRSKFKDKLR